MTRQIRLLGVGLMVCFLVLFVQLNRLTVFQAAELNDNPVNTREILRDFSQPRGSVSTADGVVIARSVPSGDRFEFQREFPEGPLFAHVTGFFSFTLGQLRGGEDLQRRAGRPHHRPPVPGPRATCSSTRTASATSPSASGRTSSRSPPSSSGEREGSVVALDPRTGEILALVSFPTYDPNLLANHDTAIAAEVQRLLDADADKPRLARTYQDRFFPGSTFKVVTATAGITRGGVTADEPVYPISSGFTAPGTTRPLRNFGGGVVRRGAVPDPAGVVQHRLRADGRRDRPRGDDRHRRGVRVQPGRAHRPHGAGPVELPDRLRAQPAGARPVGHRAERRGRHAAADGDGRRRGGQRGRAGDGAARAARGAGPGRQRGRHLRPRGVDHRHGPRRPRR